MDDYQALYHRLRSLPLVDVMAWLGHYPVRETESSATYRCPLPSHEDKNASFVVRKRAKEGEVYCSFECYGCGHLLGKGAIELVLQVTQKDSNKQTIREAVKFLCHAAQINDDVTEGTGPSYRTEMAPPNETGRMILEKEPLGWHHLHALGARLYTDSSGNTHSTWGVTPETFILTFPSFGVSACVLPAKDYPTFGRKSLKVKGSRIYPILAYEYTDEEGIVYWKKHEPLSKAYRYSYVYGEQSPTLPSNHLFADAELEEAMRTGVVRKDMKDVVEVIVKRPGKSEPTTEYRFRRIVLCSGNRDAINVYYNSDAHVCWLWNETLGDSGISAQQVETLKRLCLKEESGEEYHWNLHVCYDIDEAGRDGSRCIVMRHPDISEIVLPEELLESMSVRTGKPLKDVSELLCEWVVPRDSRYHGISKRDILSMLIRESRYIRFWREHPTKRKDMQGRTIIKHEMNPIGIHKLMAMNGYRAYEDQGGNIRFIRMNIPNVLTGVSCDRSGSQAGEMRRAVRQTMNRWLAEHHVRDLYGISNVIATSKCIDQELIKDIPTVRSKYHTWSPSEDWLFFRNGALHVTADQKALLPYSRYPGNVSEECIQPYDYEPWTGETLVQIYENEDMEQERNAHNGRIASIQSKSDLPSEQRRKMLCEENRRWMEWLSIWRWRVRFSKPMNEMPWIVQYLWNTGRIYWKEEKIDGRVLTVEEMQVESMQFISKFAMGGYLLHREKGDGADAYMCHITDYNSRKGDRNGRGGKSLFAKILSYARKQCYVDGGGMSTGEKLSLNLSNLRPDVDQMIYIDDVDPKFEVDPFFTMVTGKMTCRSLYNNPIQIDYSESPKILMSSNAPFCLDQSSRRDRIWHTMVSDYYHDADMDQGIPRWKFPDEFGCAIGPGMPRDQWNAMIELLVEMLQFQIGRCSQIADIRINAPITGIARQRQAEMTISDDIFFDWASRFFSVDEHLNRPIAKRDVYVDFLRYQHAALKRNTRLSITDDLMKRMGQVSKDGRISTFTDKLILYVQRVMGATVNPSSSLSSKSEMVRKCPQCSVETWTMNEQGEVSNFRAMQDRVACFFFSIEKEDATRPLTRLEPDAAPLPSKETKRKAFKRPSLEEVEEYCREKEYHINPALFVSHYEANGWMRGKNHIKSWKSCCATWEIRWKENHPHDTHAPSHSSDERERINQENRKRFDEMDKNRNSLSIYKAELLLALQGDAAMRQKYPEWERSCSRWGVSIQQEEH